MTLREYLDKNMPDTNESDGLIKTPKQLLERCLARGKRLTECMEEVSEGMSPDKVPGAVAKLRKGLQTCANRFRGEPQKAQACKDRIKKCNSKYIYIFVFRYKLPQKTDLNNYKIQ